MNSLTGKRSDFKDPYDSVKVQYSTDNNFVKLESGRILDLNAVNQSYYGQRYGEFKSIQTKLEFYENGKDRLMFTYVFYNYRLFEIDVYTNIDSLCQKFGKALEKYFNETITGTILGNEKGEINSHALKQKTFMSSRFQYELSANTRSLSFELIYDPVRKYLPLWCGTGRSRNWTKEIDRKLKAH